MGFTYSRYKFQKKLKSGALYCRSCVLLNLRLDNRAQKFRLGTEPDTSCLVEIVNYKERWWQRGEDGARKLNRWDAIIIIIDVLERISNETIFRPPRLFTRTYIQFRNCTSSIIMSPITSRRWGRAGWPSGDGARTRTTQWWAAVRPSAPDHFGHMF